MGLKNIKTKYTGEVAEDYEGKRKNSAKWKREQKVVKEYLQKIVSLESNPSILDIPVGTGRFFPIYDNLSLKVMGVDISEDMLKIAQEKLEKENLETNIRVKKGDIMDTSTYGINPDVVVCIRLLNWLTKQEMKKAISNLLNTGAKHVVVGIRVYSSYYLQQLMNIMRNLAVNSYKFLKNKSSNFGDKSSINIHNENSFTSEVRNNGFYIRDKKLVDNFESSYFTMGTLYYIYWLST